MLTDIDVEPSIAPVAEESIAPVEAQPEYDVAPPKIFLEVFKEITTLFAVPFTE